MNVSLLSARLRLVSAELETVLKKLVDADITIIQVEKENDLTATIFVKNTDYKRACLLLDKWGISYQILDKQENVLLSRHIFSRCILLLAVSCLLLLSLVLPGRILFVSVDGNEIVPTRMILDIANMNGVHFGAKSSDVRSENVKNKLLEAIPQLQWIGVNTSGCVATICVEEKSQTENEAATMPGISSIIAANDGIVEACTVTKGTKICKEGQAVNAGDVLISGYTDCGIVIRATKAEGEVFAQTLRKIEAVLPKDKRLKGKPVVSDVSYSLQIGKKLLNFNNSSGIYHGSCAKIYEEEYLMLPGGFVLPVMLIKETVVSYELIDASSVQCATTDVLSEYCMQYLLSQMVAGEIKHGDFRVTENDDTIILNSKYICSEMIGRQKKEDIFYKGN